MRSARETNKEYVERTDVSLSFCRGRGWDPVAVNRRVRVFVFVFVFVMAFALLSLIGGHTGFGQALENPAGRSNKMTISSSCCLRSSTLRSCTCWRRPVAGSSRRCSTDARTDRAHPMTTREVNVLYFE